MVKQKSYSDVLKENKERLKLYRETIKKFSKMKCENCGHSITRNGTSRVHGICNICISESLKPKSL